MDLRTEYEYCLSKKGKRRRRRLKKAIQDSNFDLVYEELQDLVEELDGYKSLRAEQDLSFLVDRKQRYYTERDDYSAASRSMKEVAES